MLPRVKVRQSNRRVAVTPLTRCWNRRRSSEIVRVQYLINSASSTGRCNTIQWIESTMPGRENHLFSSARLKRSQGSVPTRLTLISDLGSCFQCQAGSSLLLRRPIEITSVTGMYGPPQSCKRKTKNGSWSAPMYSAFSGVSDSGP
jgi:hypothetical protein